MSGRKARKSKIVWRRDFENFNGMENQHEKLQYELSNAKREFAKRSSKVVNISDRLK